MRPSARATGVRVGAYNMLLAVLTALTDRARHAHDGRDAASRASSSSRRCRPCACSSSFRSVTICAAVVSVVNFLLGMVLSYVLETPSGASVVVVDLVVFLLFCGVQRIRCRVEK